jgi:hypothetical protein
MVIPKQLKGFLEKVSPDGVQVEAEKIAEYHNGKVAGNL